MEVNSAVAETEPAIDADLLPKYIDFARRNCYPTMTEEAMETLREFYVSHRRPSVHEDTPVPVTARKLESLVRLAEASARVRLSDTVTTEDTERAIKLVKASLRDVGIDRETGEFDADIVAAGMSKSQRDCLKSLKGIISELQTECEQGVPIEAVIDQVECIGIDRSKARQTIQKLKSKGEAYEPGVDTIRIV